MLGFLFYKTFQNFNISDFTNFILYEISIIYVFSWILRNYKVLSDFLKCELQAFVVIDLNLNLVLNIGYAAF